MGVTTRTAGIDVIRSFLKAMEPGDYDKAMALVGPDCVYVNVPISEITVVGPEAMRGLLEPFFAPVLENEFVVRTMVCDGSVVVVERTDRHRLEGGWIELPVVGVFEVVNGLIVSWRDYFDPAVLSPLFDALAS